MSTLEALYEAVQKRPRPEDVADMILQLWGPGRHQGRAALERAARHSFRQLGRNFSSMMNDFSRPVSAEKQVVTASTVFQVETLSPADCMHPDKLTAFLESISKAVYHVTGQAKLTKAQRHAVGLFKCQRWYNKRLRIIRNLEDKIRRLAWNVRKYEFTRVGKSALATKIAFEDFSADVNTACLVAYLSARMSMRSVFTNQSQVRAFDEVAEALYQQCTASNTTRWDVIAHVMPDERVLRHLTDEQKGRLLGTWWSLLVDMAGMLQETHKINAFRKEAMIVSRGNDSSTWNQVAGGWNQARGHWISLVHAMGIQGLLNEVCPGKVMRLMAADVARWHQMSGGDVHPDTKVWAALPWPWEVVNGTAQCTRQMVENACVANAVAPETWTSQKKDQRAVAFSPTPELVHGVAVSSPALALILRKAGAFSGKGMNGDAPEVIVERDPLGFAVAAHPVDFGGGSPTTGV